MHDWSGMRKKLEQDYLAKPLRGHIRYFATTYKHSHDQEGRVAILLDDCEIFGGNYWDPWPDDILYSHEDPDEMAKQHYEGLNQRDFYEAFHIFDTQSIQESLCSENRIVRLFAVLDRRVGRRTLTTLRDTLSFQTPAFQKLYDIRMRAEAESRKAQSAMTEGAGGAVFLCFKTQNILLFLIRI